MNPKLVRGSLDTIILKLLDDNQEMYGYEISQRIKDLTKDDVHIAEGAIYPTLHKLESRGVLQVETRSIGNRYRKYYSLTPTGKSQLIALFEEMQTYIRSISLLLNPKIS